MNSSWIPVSRAKWMLSQFEVRLRWTACLLAVSLTFVVTPVLAQGNVSQPFSKQEVIKMLDRSTPQAKIKSLVLQRHIGFEVTEEVENDLKNNHGASDELIVALKESQPVNSDVKAAVPVARSEPKPEAPPLTTSDINQPVNSDVKKAVPVTRSKPKPDVPPLTTSDVNQIEVMGSFKATGSKYENGWPMYHVELRLQAPNSVLDRIEEVKYLFAHESYNPNPKIGHNRSDNFAIRYLGWGCVQTVTVTVVPASSKAASSTLPNFDLCSIWPKSP
jgi:hypothetical protein